MFTRYSPLKPLDLDRKCDKQRQYELCANVSKTKLNNNKRPTGHRGSVHQLSSDSKTTEKPPVQHSTKLKKQKDQTRNPQPNINTHTCTVEKTKSDLYIY